MFVCLRRAALCVCLRLCVYSRVGTPAFTPPTIIGNCASSLIKAGESARMGFARSSRMPTPPTRPSRARRLALGLRSRSVCPIMGSPRSRSRCAARAQLRAAKPLTRGYGIVSLLHSLAPFRCRYWCYSVTFRLALAAFDSVLDSRRTSCYRLREANGEPHPHHAPLPRSHAPPPCTSTTAAAPTPVHAPSHACSAAC